MRVTLLQQLPMLQVSNVFYPFNTSLEEEFKRLFANFTIQTQATSAPNVEDVMEEFRHNGQDFEYCPELDSDVVPETIPRRKRNKKSSPTECVFCRNNGEQQSFYRDHILKDAEGIVKCKVLRAYTCPICGATGDTAHTIKYCPWNPKSTVTTMASANAFKFTKNATGKQRVTRP